MAQVIYIITNTNSGKVYVGRGQSLKHRTTQHRSTLKYGRHWNPALQADYNADPTSIELCKVIEDGIETVEEAKAAELAWMRAFPDVYNIAGCTGRAPTNAKKCTVDGITIYPSRAALTRALGQGKQGGRSPNFRYV